jgi:predicted enzyme related to lactoylglutathione lyase
VNGFVVTVGVVSCDETIQKALEAGASFVFPKARVPQVGWLAYLTDPAGNRFGVLEPDGSAA